MSPDFNKSLLGADFGRWDLLAWRSGCGLQSPVNLASAPLPQLVNPCPVPSMSLVPELAPHFSVLQTCIPCESQGTS
jgi:hypothetical protein